MPLLHLQNIMVLTVIMQQPWFDRIFKVVPETPLICPGRSCCCEAVAAHSCSCKPPIQAGATHKSSSTMENHEATSLCTFCIVAGSISLGMHRAQPRLNSKACYSLVVMGLAGHVQPGLATQTAAAAYGTCDTSCSEFITIYTWYHPHCSFWCLLSCCLPSNLQPALLLRVLPVPQPTRLSACTRRCLCRLINVLAHSIAVSVSTAQRLRRCVHQA